MLRSIDLRLCLSTSPRQRAAACSPARERGGKQPKTGVEPAEQAAEAAFHEQSSFKRNSVGVDTLLLSLACAGLFACFFKLQIA